MVVARLSKSGTVRVMYVGPRGREQRWVSQGGGGGAFPLKRQNGVVDKRKFGILFIDVEITLRGNRGSIVSPNTQTKFRCLSSLVLFFFFP